MVERPPLAPMRRPRGPSPEEIRRRRLIALGLVAGAVPLALAVALFGWRSVRGHSAPAAPTIATAPRPLKIIFPEGFTRAQMAERITAVDRIARRRRGVRPKLAPRAYLRLTASSDLPGRYANDNRRRNLEGFLFPATYDFLPPTTSAQLVGFQLKAFRTNWGKVDLAYARKKQLTPYDVLIIASMVEKETLAPDERPLVAAVIYNRLHAGIPLGIDATIRYGLDIPGTESLHESQLNSDNPYNTRKFSGLPPGPIANPGLASMQAAAHPAKVNYLYFVRKPDKVHHFFTASFREFQNYANAHGFG